MDHFKAPASSDVTAADVTGAALRPCESTVTSAAEAAEPEVIHVA